MPLNMTQFVHNIPPELTNFSGGGNPIMAITNPIEFVWHHAFIYNLANGWAETVHGYRLEMDPFILIGEVGFITGIGFGQDIPTSISFRDLPEAAYTLTIAVREQEALGVPLPDSAFGTGQGWISPQSGTTRVNIQRTSSFIRFDGISDICPISDPLCVEDSSLSPDGSQYDNFRPESDIDPDTGLDIRNDSADWTGPVSNPSTITVGRPAHDTSVGYTSTWTISGPDIPNITGTGTTPINLATHLDLVDNGVSIFTPGVEYEITVTITETVVTTITPGLDFPSADIRSTSTATFIFDPPTLDKEVAPELANVGDVVTYTLTVDNVANNPLGLTFADFLVTDTLDSRVTFIPDTVIVDGVSAWEYDFAAGTLEVELEYLPPRLITITFDARVLPTAAGERIPNTAYLYGPADSTGNRGESLDDSEAHVDVPDMEISKTVNEVGRYTVTNREDSLRYVIRVENTSEFPATGFRIVDDLTALTSIPINSGPFIDLDSIVLYGITYDELGTNPHVRQEAGIQGGVLEVILGTVAPGASVYIVLYVDLLPEAQLIFEGQEFTNMADLYTPRTNQWEEGDDWDGIHRDYDTATVILSDPEPELNIAKLVNEASIYDAQVGEILIYTIYIENSGTATAYDFWMVDDLSELIGTYIDDVELISVVPNLGVLGDYELVDGVLTVNIISLAPNGHILITFEATVLEAAAGTNFTNIAILASDSDGENQLYRIEQDEDGNPIEVPLQDDATVRVPDEDDELPTLEKLVNGEPSYIAEVGDVLTYTITVTNNSDVNLYDHLVVDDMSHLSNFISIDVDSLSVDSEHPAIYSFDETGLILNVEISRIDVGDEVVITFTATVLEGAEGLSFTNTAHLYGPADEEGNRGDSILDDTAIVRVLHPTLTKQVCVLEPRSNIRGFLQNALAEYICEFGSEVTSEVGATLRYQLTVTNPSDNVLEDFVVSDTLDLTLVEWANNVRINGELTEDYEFDPETGEFRISLDLPSGNVYITFDVIILGFDADDEIPNIAFLLGPEDDAGDRPTIDEDEALVVPEDPIEPTDPTDPTRPNLRPPNRPTEPTDPTDPPTEPPTGPTDPPVIPTDPPTCPECPTCPTCPDCPPCPTEPCPTEPTRPTPPPSTPTTPNRPNLPQTGSTGETMWMVNGMVLLFAGLVIAVKKKRDVLLIESQFLLSPTESFKDSVDPPRRTLLTRVRGKTKAVMRINKRE